MKTVRNLAIAITLLATGSNICMADSMEALIAQVKERLPNGWTVHDLGSRTGFLQIEKDAEVLSYSKDSKPKPGKKPVMNTYYFGLRIKDVMSDEDVSAQREQAKELDEEIQELYEGLVARAVPRIFDDFIPANDEETNLVFTLQDLRSARAKLPDYFLKEHSVTWVINSPKRDHLAVVGDLERKECGAAQRAIDAILTKHSIVEPMATSDGP